MAKMIISSSRVYYSELDINDAQHLIQNLESNSDYKNELDLIVPFLADYLSSYVCFAKTKNNNELIFSYSLDEGLQKLHNSVESFFKTIITFYENNVYYLDNDGFLDYDFEKEGLVGSKYNPDIKYWIE